MHIPRAEQIPNYGVSSRNNLIFCKTKPAKINLVKSSIAANVVIKILTSRKATKAKAGLQKTSTAGTINPNNKPVRVIIKIIVTLTTPKLSQL